MNALLASGLLLASVASCSDSTATPTTANATLTDAGARADVTRADGAAPRGGGSCAGPIDLNAEGVIEGGALVFRGSTAGMPDALHPYEGCAARDAAEVVLSYRVPAGSGALVVSTEGSAYDTVLYVRAACSQAVGGADLACNDDSDDTAPQSTVHLTNLLEGQMIYLVVDGSGEMDAVSDGAFVLSLRRVPFGGSGASCFPVTEPPTARCAAALRCSEGGAADGTALCVPVVATDGTCDPRGFSNICAVGVTCVTDPAPPKGMKARAQCTLAGARRAAPCREAAPRCDSPFACSAADPPTCVAVVPLGLGCDPMGEGDRCAPGLTCSPLGDGGAAICH